MNEPIGRTSTATRSVAGTDVSVISEELERVETLLDEAVLSDAHPLVSEAASHLLRAGGKRVRPTLVLLSACAGARSGRSTQLSAAAIELVHIATLYHDDVIDETQTRRGVPTVHSRWGTEVAVLAGDYLFAKGCALGADAGGEVPGILARAIGLVCEGQIMETAALGDPSRSIDHYFSVIDRKTAALFAAACDLGAATSAAVTEDRQALVTYGQNLGLAFQVVDDVLDLIGDPTITGKEPGSDLREGVFTLPVLLARDRDPALAARLRAGERRLEHLLPAIAAGGGVAGALEAARARVTAAGTALDRLDPSAASGALGSLLEGVLAQASPYAA